MLPRSSDLRSLARKLTAVDLRGVGATIYRTAPTVGFDRVPIVHCSIELGHDLFVAGYRTADQWGEWINTVYEDSVATTYPGDLGYGIFQAKAKIGSKKVTVWFEQMDDNSACMYYPHER